MKARRPFTFAVVIASGALSAAVAGMPSALCASAPEQRGAIAYVPMYATPAAWQLPMMLGDIAGASVIEPPYAMLGDYLAPGDARSILRWLRGPQAREATAVIASTDMIAYGGLDPSRVPGDVDETLARTRLDELRNLRVSHRDAWIAAFGTVMRLEPTAVAPVGAAAQYSPIAQYPTWQYIWEYAGLHDPPLKSERSRAEQLQTAIGTDVLAQYLQTRKRDRDVDLYVLRMTAEGAFDRVVIGQDDAGPVGLHIKDVRSLEDAVAQLGIGDRASIEPGADELGSALVAAALARSIGWTPRVAVRFSTLHGAAAQDPLEFTPVGTTIEALVALCGGVSDAAHPDITLYVRVPGTNASEDSTLLAELREGVNARSSLALVDLTFLSGSYDAQAAFAQQLIHNGIAGKLDAYSAWNTAANSVGIALSEAIAAGSGRRAGTYSATAHAAFMLDRYIDDVLYHTRVRPELNAYLAARGVTDHTYLAPDVAADAERELRTLMMPLAIELLQALYPHYRATRLDVRLPWPRTFELESDVVLLPA